MRDVAHFAAGMAAAACLPGTVEAAAAGDPRHLIVGGVFGLLPNLLDRRLVQLLGRYDVEIAPDPLHPDPHMVARTLAQAADTALLVERPVQVKLHNVRADLHRHIPYTIHFEVAARSVTVQIGEPPESPGGANGRRNRNTRALPRAACACDLALDDGAAFCVEHEDGLVLRFTPEGRTVRISSQPWNRTWTHSVLFAAIAGVATAAALGPRAGIAALAAIGTHLVLDHVDRRGCSLHFPFAGRRGPGLGRLPDDAPLADAAVAWGCLLVTFLCLLRTVPHAPSWLNPVRVAAWAGVLPWAVAGSVRRLRPATPGRHRDSPVRD